MPTMAKLGRAVVSTPYASRPTSDAAHICDDSAFTGTHIG